MGGRHLKIKWQEWNPIVFTLVLPDSFIGGSLDTDLSVRPCPFLSFCWRARGYSPQHTMVPSCKVNICEGDVTTERSALDFAQSKHFIPQILKTNTIFSRRT